MRTLAMCFALVWVAGAQTETGWTHGAGRWSDAVRWSHGLPNSWESAVVGGESRVVVGSGTHLAGDLQIGFNAGDRAHVEVDGGQLVLLQDSLRVGEYSGGEAEFVLNSGA